MAPTIEHRLCLSSKLGSHPLHDPSRPAGLHDLPTEIIQHIYMELNDVESIRSLALTSHRYNRAFAGSQKLIIVEKVLETQFGPLHDAIQLVTLNSGQSAHIIRNPAFSLALARQMLDRGRVVNRWVELWPLLLWRSNTHDRRFLTSQEAYKVRRALYRFWTYNEMCSLQFEYENWTARRTWFNQFVTRELRELEEVLGTLEEMLKLDCCPSDSRIQRHHSSLSPTRDLLDFSKLSQAQPVRGDTWAPARARGIGDILVSESWGDNTTVAYEVAHLIRMTPGQILYFREVCTCRAERMDFVDEVVSARACGGQGWGIYEFPSGLRWDFMKVFGSRGDAKKKGHGMLWITWEPDDGRGE